MLPNAQTPLPGQPQWADLVQRIRNGDTSAMEELYGVFSHGIRFYLCRQLGPQDLDDRVHETFLTVAQAIQRGDVREPERLMGFVRTIVRRQVAAYIEEISARRRQQADLDTGLTVSDGRVDPEAAAIERENQEIAWRVLNAITPRDREILIRFYLHEQRPEQICREMNLTETQFRLLKSRAKARFGELGRRRLGRRRGYFW